MAWKQTQIFLDLDQESQVVSITVGQETKYIHIDELRSKCESRYNAWDTLLNNLGVFISLDNKRNSSFQDIKTAVESARFRFNG